jgi:hypothetical protein
MDGLTGMKVHLRKEEQYSFLNDKDRSIGF